MITKNENSESFKVLTQLFYVQNTHKLQMVNGTVHQICTEYTQTTDGKTGRYTKYVQNTHKLQMVKRDGTPNKLSPSRELM